MWTQTGTERRPREGVGTGHLRGSRPCSHPDLGHPARSVRFEPRALRTALSKPTRGLCGKCWLAAWLKGGLTLQAGWGQVSPRSEEVSVTSPSKYASGGRPPPRAQRPIMLCDLPAAAPDPRFLFRF